MRPHALRSTVARGAPSVRRAVGLAVGIAGFVAATAIAGKTTRESVGPGGIEGNGTHYNGSISSNGRYVAFQSTSTTLDPADPMPGTDIFLRDRKLGTTRVVSVDLAGAGSSGYSAFPVVSKDGRFVAYESYSTNLVASDTNGQLDVFVRDMKAGITTRISVDSAGTQANGASYNPSMSDDGRYVAFMSEASNLVAGDLNSRADVFLHDRKTGTTSIVSVTTAGNQGGGNSNLPSLSADGRFVAFESESPLVPTAIGASQVYVRDLALGVTTQVSLDSSGAGANAASTSSALSKDGRYVAFVSGASNLVPGDTNGQSDVFVRDRKKGATTRVSIASSGVQTDNTSFRPAISGNGRIVAFESYASNLVAGDGIGSIDSFLHDRKTGLTTAASVDTAGTLANAPSGGLSISANGRFVVFESAATNLVAGDGNGLNDVFLRDRKD